MHRGASPLPAKMRSQTWIVFFDPASQGIKFAGWHLDPMGAGTLRALRGIREVLRAKFGRENPSFDRFLAAYSQIQNDIHGGGGSRPGKSGRLYPRRACSERATGIPGHFFDENRHESGGTADCEEMPRSLKP